MNFRQTHNSASESLSTRVSLLSFHGLVFVWWLLMCQLILCFWPVVCTGRCPLFRLAFSQLPGAATKLLWVATGSLPPHAQEYHLHDYYTIQVHPAARQASVEVLWSYVHAKWQEFEAAVPTGGDECTKILVWFVFFSFSCAGWMHQNPEWAWAFINHLAGLSCANNWSSDASKQHLFTCRASLALRGQTLS